MTHIEDLTSKYLNTLEQDAIEHPKFEINMIVSSYKNAGYFIAHGKITDRNWSKTEQTYIYQIYIENVDDHLFMPEHRLDRYYVPYGARTIRSHWFTVVKGGY